MEIFKKKILGISFLLVGSLVWGMDRDKTSIDSAATKSKDKKSFGRPKFSLDKKSTSSTDSPRLSPKKDSPKGTGKSPQNTGLKSSSGEPKAPIQSLSELQAIMARKQSERVAQSEGSGSVK